jgi:hypothetical protein
MREGDFGRGHVRTTRWRKRVWLAAMVVVSLVAAAWLLWTTVLGRDRRSADERLAEIEAARAIPDSENAATIYNQLLQDSKAASLLTYLPEFLEPPIFDRVRREPWLGKDRPELMLWIKEHQYIVDKLLEASQFEKCRFPISIDPADLSEMNRAPPMRQWGFLLSMASNNDLAEGRVNAALIKWHCLLQMENHLRQQPLLIDHLLANYLAQLALELMACFITTGDSTETHLQKIEAMSLPTSDGWAEHEKETRVIEALRSQKITERTNSIDYFRHPIRAFRAARVTRAIRSIASVPSPFDAARDSYRQTIATARGIHILIALKRYKVATGHWPDSLERIQSLTEEILTDPINGSSFIYKRAADTFALYSQGRNNIDNRGRWEPDTGLDDWPIWPPRAQSPAAKPPDANGV